MGTNNPASEGPNEQGPLKRAWGRLHIDESFKKHYLGATMSRRCGIAALVAFVVMAAVVVVEVLLGVSWTDSRGDYYSGMIGVTIALAGVSVTGYIFLTEHMGSHAIRDSAYDTSSEQFNEDAQKAMGTLLVGGVLLVVCISAFVFLDIDGEAEYAVSTVEYLSPTVLLVLFIMMSAAFIQFDYDLVTVDKRMRKSAERLEREYYTELKKDYEHKFKSTDKVKDEKTGDGQSRNGQRDDCLRKFYEVESIIVRITGTPEHEQMLEDYVLSYETRVRDENPENNEDIQLIRDFFAFRKYKDYVLNVQKAESEKGKNRDSIKLEENQIEMLLSAVNYLTSHMIELYRNKTIDGVVLKNYSFAGANLRHTSLSSSILTDCDFSSVRGAGIKLSNSDIDGMVTNSDTTFDNGILHDTHITKPVFDGLSIEGADFRGCLIIEPNMVNAKAAKSEYSNVKMIGGNISKTDLSNSNFNTTALIGVEVSNDKLVTCHMVGCTMNRIEWDDIDASHAEIMDTDFTSSVLRRLNLSNVRLESVFLNNSKLCDSAMTSSLWTDSKVISSVISSERDRMLICRTHIERTEFVSVLFRDVTLRGVFLDNVVFMDCRFEGVDLGDSVFKSCEFHHTLFDEYCSYNDITMRECHRSGEGLPAGMEAIMDGE